MIAGEDSNGNTKVYEAGSTAGRTIEIENPWATQEMCNSVLAAIEGYSYKPFSADGAILNPAAEIGDAVSVNGVYSVLADIDTTFSPIMSARIGAREDSNIDHEYPYESSEQREFQRSMAETKTSFIVEQGRISGEIQKMNDPEVFGSIANKVASLELTTEGISESLTTKYLTSEGVAAEITAAITLSEGNITSTVSETYQTITQAGADLAAAKGYTDDREAAITRAYKSEIVQTARSITATVASATDKYDLSPILSAMPEGTTIIRRYGVPNLTLYPPAQYNGQAYVDINTGNWWTSNGTKWSRQGRLNTVTATLQSSINLTNEGIKAEVSRLDRVIGDAKTQIQVNADAISAVVNGSTAPEWNTDGSDGDGHYYVGNIVCVSTYQDVDGVETLTGRNYYKCIDDHTSTARRKPGVGADWDLYWEETNAPTVQTMIDASLEGLVLSYKASNEPNSAEIVLSRNGVDISGKVITMGNVEAETLSASASITTPYIYDSSGDTRFVMDSTNHGMKLQRKYGTTWQNSLIIYDNGSSIVSFSSFGTMYFYLNGFGKLMSGEDITWDFSNATKVIMPDGTEFTNS